MQVSQLLLMNPAAASTDDFKLLARPLRERSPAGIEQLKACPAAFRAVVRDFLTIEGGANRIAGHDREAILRGAVRRD